MCTNKLCVSKSSNPSVKREDGICIHCDYQDKSSYFTQFKLEYSKNCNICSCGVVLNPNLKQCSDCHWFNHHESTCTDCYPELNKKEHYEQA